MVDVAAHARKRLLVPVLPSTLDECAFPSGSFDIVSLLGVLEHLHEPLATLRQVRQLLSRDGVVAVYVPNYHYLRLKDAGIAAWIRRGQASCLAPEEHLFHFTPRLLEQLLRESGLRLIQLDLGQPFLSGSRWRAWLKRGAASAAQALHRATRIHLGGIEAIACRDDAPRAQFTEGL
jgi:SAM-dependent methyltransferase